MLLAVLVAAVALVLPSAAAEARVTQVGKPAPRPANSALQVGISATGPVRAGTPAELAVRVRDRGLTRHRVRGLRLAVQLGDGLAPRSAAGRRWRCGAVSGSRLRCRYRGVLPRRGAAPPLRVRAVAHAGRVGERVAVLARARARRGAAVEDTGRAAVRVRAPLRVRAVAGLPVVADRNGPTTARRPGVGMLRADVQGAGTAPVRIRWRLLGDRRVRWQRPFSARSRNPRFIVPDVAETTVLRFRATVTDGVATARSTVSVRVLDASRPPRTVPYRAKRPRQRLTLSVADRTVRAGRGRFVTLAARASGDAPLAVTWRQAGGPPVVAGPVSGSAVSFRTPARQTRLRFVVTARDGSGDRLRRSTVVRVRDPARVRGGFGGGGGGGDCAFDPFNCSAPPEPTPPAPKPDPVLQLGQCRIDVDAQAHTDCTIMTGVVGHIDVSETTFGGSIVVSMAGVDSLVFPFQAPIPDSLTNYTLTLPAAAWDPLAGRSLQFPGIAPTLVQQGSALTFQATASVAAFAPYGTDDVSVSGAVLALEGNCVDDGAGSCAGAIGATFRGSVTAEPSPALTSQVSTPFETTLGTGTPTGVATFPSSDRLASDASLHDMNVDVGFGLSSPSGIEVVVSGLADVSEWTDRTFATAYSAEGKILQAALGEVVTGFPLGLFLSDHDADDVEPETFTGVAENVDLVADRPTIASSFTLPEGQLAPLGLTLGGDHLTAVGAFSPVSGAFSLSIDGIEPPGSQHTLVDQSGFSLTLGTLGLDLWREKGGELQLQIRGPLTFGTPAGDLTLALAGSATLPGGLLSASATLPDGNRWSNALGVPGIDVSELAVAISQTETGVVYGFAGTGTLPSWAQTVLGFSSDAAYTLGGALGDGAPCLFFDVEPGPSGNDAVNLLRLNVAKARSATFVWAPDPDGCVVGAYEYRSGYSVVAEPVILGEALKVDAQVTLSGGDVSAVEATGSVGDLDFGPLALDDAKVDAAFHKLSGTGALGISGNVAMLGGSAGSVNGTLSANAIGTTTLSLSGTYAPPPIGALKLPAGALTVSGTGTARSVSAMSGTLRTSLSALGVTSADEQLSLSWSGGTLDSFSGTLPPLDLTIGGAGLTGSATLGYDGGTRQATGTFTGTVELPRLPAYSVTGTLTPDLTGVDLDTGTLSASATLDTDLTAYRASMRAQLHAAVRPSGTTITGSGSATLEGRVKLGSFANAVQDVPGDFPCGLTDAVGSASRLAAASPAPTAHAANLGGSIKSFFTSTADSLGSVVTRLEHLVNRVISAIKLGNGLSMTTRDLTILASNLANAALSPFAYECQQVREQTSQWQGWHTVGTGDISFQSPNNLAVTVDGITLTTGLTR